MTVANNNAGSGIGGGIQIGNSAWYHAALFNTIVAGNYNNSGADDVDGTFSSTSAYNLIGAIDGSTGLTSVGSMTQSGTKASPLNAHLGTLGNYGGLTKTIPLLSNSTAIDRGSNTIAQAYSLALDQRGHYRIVDWNLDGSSNNVDIGAFELALEELYT